MVLPLSKFSTHCAKMKFSINDVFSKCKETFTEETLKGAVTDMIYFARSKFSVSLVHKKNFSLI